jgi:hypothetical protein
MGYIPGTNPEVDAWVNLLNSGQASITNLPATLKKELATALSGGQATSAEQTQKTIDQITFLKSSVARAKALQNASGASGLSRKMGDWFIGDTKFNQLQAETNTLRTNVLTLMTDPSIRKYFGPQMSNADVQLMTAAGTTLNPEFQSPAQMKEELMRLEDLFGRMEQAVTNGMNQGGGSDEITVAQNAPVGSQVFINGKLYIKNGPDDYEEAPANQNIRSAILSPASSLFNTR